MNTTYYYNTQVLGANLIVNGDFESGNTGFQTDYVYHPSTAGSVQGIYHIANNPNVWLSAFSACTDHTLGAGNDKMMMIDGSTVVNTALWKQTINVQPNTNYLFSGWVQSIVAQNPAQLVFKINGNSVGSTLIANLASCTWKQFSIQWNSGNTSTASLSIVDNNLLAQGNDFAIDDISFTPVTIKTDSLNVDVINCPIDPCNNWLKAASNPSYVECGDISITGDKLTIEAKFNNPSNINTTNFHGGKIVSKHTNAADCNYSLMDHTCEITTQNTGYIYTPKVCFPSLDKQYHVAMVYDGSVLKFYRDGILMSQIAASGNLVQNNLLTAIAQGAGASAGALSQYFGLVNEVRIWNVVRSQQQIQQFMNDTLPSPTTQNGLVAYYIFNSLKNKQGNSAYDGTLKGAATINETNPNCSFIADSCGIIPSCTQTYNWTTWQNFYGDSAIGVINNSGQNVNVTMTANYTFSSTSGIYNYASFNSFNGNIPNSTVPQTTWSAGVGGTTTMCFNQQVKNPVLLLSSLGAPGSPVALKFSRPYIVVYDGGGNVFNNDSTITGAEGYAIIMFPGDFTCVSIYSTTPEFYTNITWGLNPPLFSVTITGNTANCDSVSLTANGGINYSWNGGLYPNSKNNVFKTSGVYFVTVTDANNCTVTTSVDVTVNNCNISNVCKGVIELHGHDNVKPPLPIKKYFAASGFTWETWFNGSYYVNENTTVDTRSKLISALDIQQCQDIVLGFGWPQVAQKNTLCFVADGPNGCADRDNTPCTYFPAGGFQPNTWYHVAAVRDYANNTSKLYVNGALVDSKTNNHGPINPTLLPGFIFGSWTGIGSTDSGFAGKMDEIRIWNKPRTAAEIQANYNKCLSGNETGLVAYYHSNEKNGNVLHDVSPNGNNAALSSTITLNKTLNAPITNPCSLTTTTDSTKTIVQGQSYWGYTTSGTYKDTLVNSQGCDSIRTLNLTVISNITKASFIAPDTVCVNSPVNIKNTSTGATRYNWNFCTADINSAPIATNLGNITNNFHIPVFMDYVFDNGNYYGFVVNHSPGGIVRLDFGSSLLNTPVTVNLGNIGGIMNNVGGNEGVQIIKQNGKYFMFLVGGTPLNGTSPKLVRFEFGTNITNPSPITTEYPNIGNMNEPIDLYTFQDGNNWYGFTVNAENNTLTRFDLTSDLTNPPSAVNLGNIGNQFNYPTGICVLNDNGFWRVFVTNAKGNSDLIRLDFGNSLLNTPVAVNLGNPNGVLSGSRDIFIIKYCDELVGYVANGTTNSIVRLNFASLTSTPIAVDFGNIGNFSLPHSFAKLFRVGSDVYSFVTNAYNNTITRLQFQGCTSSSIPNSSSQTPPQISYNTPGTYNINLTIDEGLSTESSFCKKIVVTAIKKDSITHSICQGQSYLGYTATGIYRDTFHTSTCDSIRTLNLTVNNCTQTCKAAIQLNGNNKVLLPAPESKYYSTSGFTWETWFNASSYDNDNTTIGLRNILMGVVDPVLCEDIFIGFGGFVNVPKNSLSFSVDGIGQCGNRDNNPCYYKPTNGFLANTWYHVAGVRDYANNKTFLYLNGQLVDSKSNFNPAQTRDIPTFLGKNTPGADSGFAGKLDDIRIWNYPRNATEIQTNYDKCLNGNETGLVVYYRSNEANAIVLKDASINGNDGTLDATVVINKTINAPLASSCQNATFYNESKEICHGQTYWGYNSTKVYSDTLINSTGCDSIRVLNLKVLPAAVTTKDSITGCGLVLFNGINYTRDTTLTTNTKNYLGCDSIISQHQIITNSYIKSILDTSICPGQNYLGYNNTGSFSDTFHTIGGCDSIRTLKLALRESPQINLPGDTSICENDSIVINLSNNYFYQWNNNSTANHFSVKKVGFYLVKAIDSFGCKASDSFRLLSLYPSPKHFLPNPYTVCSGEQFTLPNFISYHWMTGEITATITLHNYSYYSVQVIDSNACIGSDTMKIIYLGSDKFVFSNAFSPNNDGLNDFFKPIDAACVTEFEMTIFDRWGQQTFQTHNVYGDGWNGKYNGRPAPVGVYYYIINYKNASGESKKQSGSITLLR